jgi:hypothetical protein
VIRPKFGLLLILATVTITLSSSSLFSQSSGAAVPFITYNPSPMSVGMGQAGVALTEYDPYCMFSNPALPGLAAQSVIFNFGFYPQSTELLRQFSSVTYYSMGGYAGYKFKDPEQPLSIAVGYLRQYVDLGVFTRTAEDGTVLGRFQSEESSDGLNFSMGYDWGVKLGFGMNVKFINSELTTIMGPPQDTKSKATAFDLGLMALIPIFEGYEIAQDMSLNVNAGIGASLRNFGDPVEYRGESDPLPRSSVLGYSINSSIRWQLFDRMFDAIKLEWTAEADDLLVSRDSLGYRYENIYSDLQPINNIILLDGSQEIDVRYGLSVSIMDLLQFYVGGLTNSFADDVEDTHGYSIHLNGLLKALDKSMESPFWSYLTSHFDLYYYNSTHEVSYGGVDEQVYGSFDRIYSGIALKVFGY